MASALTRFQQATLVEAVENGVYDTTMPDDEVALDFIEQVPAVTVGGRTTDMANSADENAAWYEARWSLLQSRGGRVSGSAFGGTQITNMGPYSDVTTGQAPSQLFLNPLYTPRRSYFNCKMRLKPFKGQVAYNEDDVRAELITRPITDILGGMAEDALFMVRKNIANCWWGDGTGALAQVSTAVTIPAFADTANTTEANAVTLKTPGGPYPRFEKGQRYVIGETTTSATKFTQRGGTIICTNVNPHSRKVWFETAEGVAAFALVADDYIIMEGMVDFSGSTFAAQSRACEGVESLVRPTGTFPGGAGTGWDVAKRIELQGFVEGSETALQLPIPEVIAEVIDKMTDGKKRPPRMAISQQNVRTMYAQLERAAVATYMVPQGQDFQASGGVSAPRLSHMGWNPTWVPSNMCRTNTLHALEPSSFKKFAPTGVGRIRWITQTGDRMDGSPVFERVWVGSQRSEVMSADFEYYYQFGCTDPTLNLRFLGLRTQADN